MTSGGDHEIEAARQRLAAARATQCRATKNMAAAKAVAASASKNLQRARAMLDAANENVVIASSDVRISGDEVDEAEKALSEAEGRRGAMDAESGSRSSAGIKTIRSKLSLLRRGNSVGAAGNSTSASVSTMSNSASNANDAASASIVTPPQQINIKRSKSWLSHQGNGADATGKSVSASASTISSRPSNDAASPSVATPPRRADTKRGGAAGRLANRGTTNAAANVSRDTVIVEGAGTAEVNGTYRRASRPRHGREPAYCRRGTWRGKAAEFTLCRGAGSGTWHIRVGPAGAYPDSPMYVSEKAGSVEGPPVDCRWKRANEGIDPAPRLRFGGPSNDESENVANDGSVHTTESARTTYSAARASRWTAACRVTSQKAVIFSSQQQQQKHQHKQFTPPSAHRYLLTPTSKRALWRRVNARIDPPPTPRFEGPLNDESDSDEAARAKYSGAGANTDAAARRATPRETARSAYQQQPQEDPQESPRPSPDSQHPLTPVARSILRGAVLSAVRHPNGSINSVLLQRAESQGLPKETILNAVAAARDRGRKNRERRRQQRARKE